MPQPDRTTLIALGPQAATADPSQRVLQAVRDAVQGEYEVLGELGRNAAGVSVFLARQLRVGSLVALRARPAEGPASANEIWLDVMRQLDASMPGPREQCASCNRAIGSWDRFCGHCGADLSGSPGDRASADQMLQAVRDAAGARYEVIGAMNRADGGGDVYFARDRRTGALTALRLKRDTSAAHGDAPQYLLGRTTVLKSVAESLGVSHGGPPPLPAPPPAAVAPPIAAPAPAAPPPVSMPMAPASPPQRDAGWQRVVLGVIVGGAAAALIVALVVRRSGTAASSSASATPVTTGATNAASVNVTVGGVLPRGTIVTVDGEAVTPPTFSVPTGVHTFRASAPGYATAMESLTLSAGQNLVWTPTITRTSSSTGVRHLASAPSAAAAAPPVAPPPAPVTTPVTSAASVATTPPATPAPAVSRNDSALASLPTTTSAPTCASLFSTLEWDRALPVCQREAAAGNVASQRTLGTLYDRGLGTHANPGQAAIWYAKASDAGDRLAQYQFGVLLREGTGIKADPKRAFDLFQKSAAQGDADAKSALGTAYERGEGVKRDYVQAAQWYRQAAEQGLAGAAYRLGALYERGEGVPKSDSAAVAWWTRAAAAGEPGARAELAKRAKN